MPGESAVCPWKSYRRFVAVLLPLKVANTIFGSLEITKKVCYVTNYEDQMLQCSKIPPRQTAKVAIKNSMIDQTNTREKFWRYQTPKKLSTPMMHSLKTLESSLSDPLFKKIPSSEWNDVNSIDATPIMLFALERRWRNLPPKTRTLSQ